MIGNMSDSSFDKERSNAFISSVILRIFLSFLFFMLFATGYKFFSKIDYSTADITILDCLFGKAQSSFANYYKEHIPYKDTFESMYNQFRYSVMDEGTKGWIIGKDKYIFDKTQSYNYVTGAVTCSDEQFDDYARKVLFLQNELQREGKVFVYLITPFKSQFNSERLPARYTYYMNEYGIPDISNYTKLKEAFDHNGVLYFDATTTLERIKREGSFPNYGTTRTHWTNYAAASVTSDLFSYLGKIYSKTYPSMLISTYESEPSGTDKELATMMKINRYKSDEKQYDVSVLYDHKMYESLFMLGTSFLGQMSNVMQRDSQAFDEINYYVYLTRRQTSNNAGFFDETYKNGELVQTSILFEDLLDADTVVLESCGILGIIDSHTKFLDYAIDKIINGNHITMENVDCYGWSKAEGDFRWSVDRKCMFKIQQPIRGKGTRVSMKLISYGEPRNVDISINGEYLKSIMLRDDEARDINVDVDNEMISENGDILIEFSNYGDLYSPQEKEGKGLIGDRRTLGIGCSSLIVRYE